MRGSALLLLIALAGCVTHRDMPRETSLGITALLKQNLNRKP